MAIFPPPFLRSLTYLPAGQSGFPYDLPCLRAGFTLNFTAPITVITGENGAGKSTLLEAIAEHLGFGGRGGNRNHCGDAIPRPLADWVKALRFGWRPKVANGFFFRAETYAALADYLDTVADPIPDADGQPRLLAGRSHGEGTLALMEQRLARPGPALYLFDEPEAALSPRSQLALRHLLSRTVAQGEAQIILATHSPLLMPAGGGRVWWLDQGIRECAYTETPHFAIYRDAVERASL